MNPTPLLALLLVLLSTAAVADTQSLDSIRATAESFVRSKLPAKTGAHFISAGTLDNRLRLQPCTTPLDAFSNSHNIAARTSVGVRCSAPTWTVYVPVTLEVEVPVLVLRRALARRTRVTPADVESQVRRLPGSAASFITDPALLQGQLLKHSLPAGAALTTEALAPDVLVRRGQQVTLIAQTGGIEIRAQGQALSDGSANQRIRVQNLSSSKVVEGIVESDHVVRVGI